MLNDTKQINQANDFAQFLSFVPTWIMKQFLRLPYDKVCFFTGNQFGKTSLCLYSYVLRAFGTFPVPWKNVLYFECRNGHLFTRPAPWPGFDIWNMQDGECFTAMDRKSIPTIMPFPKDLKCPICGTKIKIHGRNSQIFRLCSENLPGDTDSKGPDTSEVSNRTYPELKKWLPAFLVKKDITHRNMALTIGDPNAGIVFGEGEDALLYAGRDIVFEFVSYSQKVQAGAGQQRISVFCDEEPSFAFYEEQKPRLLAEEGDLVLALTPANRTTYTFDEFFERAEIYLRTKAICEFLEKQNDPQAGKQIVRTEERTGIAVLQASTDDNPTLKTTAIDSMLEYDDPDTIATRRYGIFRQATGRIFKEFDRSIHVIDPYQYFPDGKVPHGWVHGRGIDVHPQTPWSCGAASLSPTNELFIWLSIALPPDKYTTLDIMTEFTNICEDYRFHVSLCDPEAETIKKDTVSVYNDINRITMELKRQGIGTGGYWMTWNTKGDFGRDQIKLRLKNSRLCGKPFSNVVVSEGRKKVLPTIWIFNTCKHAIDSMGKWSWEPWTDQRSITMKDEKNTPQQKWSHINMVWEALLKCQTFTPNSRYSSTKVRDMGKQYFRKR